MSDQPNKVGRPTEYRPEMCDEVVKNCMLGNWSATYDQIADFFGVHRTTITNWMEEHPEFFCAVKRAKLLADNRVEGSLFYQATSGNVTAQIFWLKNRRPSEWREKQELSAQVSGQIEHLHVRPEDLAGLTDEELAKFKVIFQPKAIEGK
jgi:hypothetical protein